LGAGLHSTSDFAFLARGFTETVMFLRNSGWLLLEGGLGLLSWRRADIYKQRWKPGQFGWRNASFASAIMMGNANIATGYMCNI
jgi:hypothetical protein